MSGINYYPSRNQKSAQRVIPTDANIAVTAANMGSLFSCFSASIKYITLSEAEDNKIPVGAQVDFLRLNSNVQFSAPSGSIVYESSAGETPQLRVYGSACTFIKLDQAQWAIIGDITT
jgi:hypothetical protein